MYNRKKYLYCNSYRLYMCVTVKDKKECVGMGVRQRNTCANLLKVSANVIEDRGT